MNPKLNRPKVASDFEDALAVVQVDDCTWEGKHPLRLPLAGARGVYGGHLCAQTLLVAIESAPGYIPHLFHSHFIKPGRADVKLRYRVTKMGSGDFCVRHIYVLQKDVIAYTAMCLLKKPGATPQPGSDLKSAQLVTGKPAALGTGVLDVSGTVGAVPRVLLRSRKVEFPSSIQAPPPKLHKKYPDPAKAHHSYHTDFIHNAYSDEFLQYELCPEEENMPPAERWITLWSKLFSKHPKFKRPEFNYVGLADLSDAAILTTLARALHMDWNPTIDNPFESFDNTKDARLIMPVTLNALHIFHYIAMSLDHHLYFHTDDYNSIDVLGEWLTLTYQYKILKNLRTLVRGHFYNPKGECVVLFIQEGLTFMRPGVPNARGRRYHKA